MQIIAGMLVRNEEKRWLEQVLREVVVTAKDIVVIDDCSTDKTPEICAHFGCDVIRKTESLWATNEVQRRKELWERCTAKAENGDWILILDADEVPVNLHMLPRVLNNSFDGVAFRLYDMWDKVHYRDDEMWTAHKRPWIMCVRYNPEVQYWWNEQALHCGRFPVNAVTTVADCTDWLHLKHMGWSSMEDRITKYKRYKQADPDGKYGILAQYESILDLEPNVNMYISPKAVIGK